MKTSGGRFRSSDLWVMSPTRFRCATPLSGDHNGSNPPGLVGSTPRLLRDRAPRTRWDRHRNWAPRHHNLWDRHPEGGTLDHWEFRDRNPWQPRSRVRTLRIETQESGSNPIGIETRSSVIQNAALARGTGFDTVGGTRFRTLCHRELTEALPSARVRHPRVGSKPMTRWDRNPSGSMTQWNRDRNPRTRWDRTPPERCTRRDLGIDTGKKGPRGN